VTEPSDAVFLSYASQDQEAAQRICQALRAGGIEVWFDQSELRGGDAWDRQIREQIHNCRLFIPIISANSERRDEGYFRREWSLAADRTRDMALKRAFLVPVVIDGTPQRGASVPDKFHELQWTRLPGGVTPPAFVTRVAALLDAPGPVASANPTGPAPVSRPRDTRNARTVWIALALVALPIIVGGGWFALQRSALHRHAEARVTVQSLPAAPEKSIAVLPFDDLSEKHDQQYFADGMADELLDLLTRIPQLRVIGRTSSFQFRGKAADLRTIGNRLGASYLLEGSVRRSDNRFRITVQLLSATDGVHRWSKVYDAPVGDIFGVQSEIAEGIARAMEIELAPEEIFRGQTTRNPEANDDYLKALHEADKVSAEGFQAAEQYLRAALELDPGFTRAAEVLIAEKDAVAEWGVVPANVGWTEARKLTTQMLREHPNSAIAHASMANIYVINDLDWPRAEIERDRALALDPRNPYVIIVSARVDIPLGRNEAALQQSRKALLLDPFDPIFHVFLGWLQIRLGHLKEAEDAYREALAISPSYSWAHWYLGVCLLEEGRYEEALNAFNDESNEAPKLAGRALVYFALKRMPEADHALATLETSYEDWPLEVAYVYAYRNEKEEALRWLDRAYELRGGDSDLPMIKNDPLLKNLEQDARYKAFLRKMNLPE
jgi:TolB-like protein/lipoprotein NlpI